MRAITTANAPAAIGPYSQAVEHNGLLFISGQLPIDPETGDFCSDDPVEQAIQCIKNIREIASAAGADLSDTVKTTILLTDLGTFPEINETYGSFFSSLFLPGPRLKFLFYREVQRLKSRQ